MPEIAALHADFGAASDADFSTANTAEIAALDADFDAASDADFLTLPMQQKLPL